SVLYVAAHPDDENTRLLTYFSKDKLYKTGYLSLTRGDGGQNLIGDEQGVELGLIRTQELLAARRIDGAEQFFSRAYDFGYSKTPEETFSKWNKEKILSDVVWIIRKFQPDIIITRFPTTGEGGHGHHTASAILANEAFTAAADPKRFPDQLQHVKPWQAKRILWNSFNFNNASHPADAFKMDVGGYNAALGKSYGEIAADSRSQHKSQGFGVARTRGEAFEFFRATGGSQPQKDLFEGVVTDWGRIKEGNKIQKLISDALTNFDFVQPAKSVPQLVKIYRSLQRLEPGSWRDQKLTETESLIEMASGLWIEAFTPQPSIVQGDSVRMNIVVNNRSGINAVLKQVTIENFDSSTNHQLESNKNFFITKTIKVSETTPLSQPYWLEQKMDEGSFNVTNITFLGAPEITNSFIGKINLLIEGEPFQFSKPLLYKHTDPVKGELYQPLVVLPSVIIDADESLKLTSGNNIFSGVVNATAKRKNISGIKMNVEVKEPGSIKTKFNPDKINFTSANQIIPI
ncbi:MAG TPA: PIG-L family deacetylase, partial [Flavisolibacter sp.]|nr:PIG-L family deacetylase [Flavisolibacter sp.]